MNLDKCHACSGPVLVECYICGKMRPTKDGKHVPHIRAVCTGSRMVYESCPGSNVRTCK